MLIEVAEISKTFQQRKSRSGEEAAVAAVNEVSISIAAGSMLSLVGASGSGKTTLLRCIAGLEAPDKGAIRIGDREMFSSSKAVNVPTELRNLGLIFQSYALWPNLTVGGNVAYPLRRRGIGASECSARVQKHLRLVGCEHLADRYPHQLSGGQQQRIALARALVYEPSVMLFDEPLSNLDPSLREHLRSQIREIKRSVGFTGVYVTHDLAEAFYLGDQVAIISRGSILQVGTPDDIFLKPSSPVIAHFIGAANVSVGEIADGGRTFQSAELGRMPLGMTDLAQGLENQPAVLMTRPESVRFQPTQNGASARVVDRMSMGAFDEYVLEFPNGKRWRARLDRSARRQDVGSRVHVDIPSNAAFVYPNPRGEMFDGGDA